MILVFKTNITENDVVSLHPIFNQFDEIKDWNTDLEDCDNILRIVSRSYVADEVIKKLNNIGIECCELK